ncbi:unnamed protein product [Closterium sp. NIES-54]
MDVWGPARVRGQGHKRYFLLVVDDYSRYTTIFPLRSKGEVTEGIRQTFTLPASPQQNGIAERRIGMVMDVARTSMIHAVAPHFLWPFAVQYAAHQINLQPRVSLPETTPTLRWTGKVGDASAFRVWGFRAFGPAPSGVSQVDPAEPVEVAVDSGAARGADPAGAGTGGAETGGAESEGAESGGAESESGAAGGAGAAGRGAGAGAAGGAAGAGGATGATGGAGAAGGGAGVGAAGGAAGAGAARGAAGTGDPEAEGTNSVSAISGGAARPRPYYVPLLQQVLGSPPSPGPPSPFLSPPPVQSQSQLQPASPLPGPSPYSGPTRGLTERREPESRPVSPLSCSASPVHTVRTGLVLRPRLLPLPGTHSMTLRPSTGPQRVPLPSPPASSLPDGPDPESDSLRAASPTLTRFMATAVTDPLFESSAASALVAELVEFAAACSLDYATSLVAESASVSVCPPSVAGECALGTDVLEDRQEDLECFATASPHLAAMDAEMASWKSTGTYIDEVPPPGANIVSGMWIFRVKRPPGSPPAFKARYVARGFSQRQGVDFFQTFSPTPNMTTLQVLLHVAAQCDYELHSLDFSAAFLQGSLHEEIWLRRPPGFTGSFLADDLVFATGDTEALAHVKSELQKRHTCTDLGELTSYLGLRITRDRAQRTITLTQSHMVQQVLQRFNFTYSLPQSTPLPTGHSLSAPSSDESIEPSGQYPELVGCLMCLMTCTRPDLAYPLSLLARGRHRKVHLKITMLYSGFKFIALT